MSLLTMLTKEKLISPNQLKYLNSMCSALPSEEAMANAVIKYLGMKEEFIVDKLNEIQTNNTYHALKINESIPQIKELNSSLAMYSVVLLDRSSNGDYICGKISNGVLYNKSTIGSLLHGHITYVNVLAYPLQSYIKSIASETMLSSLTLKEVFPDESMEMNNTLDIILIDAIDSKCTDVHISTVYDIPSNTYKAKVLFRDNPDVYEWNKLNINITQLEAIKNILCLRANKNSSDANRLSGLIFSDSLHYNDIEFRISIMSFDLPSEALGSDITTVVKGYTITMRIQPKDKNVLPISELNLGELSMKDIELSSHILTGLVCISGAMGAGKNTTYASIVNEVLKHRTRIIWELGMPIEYKLPIVQIPVINEEDVRLKVINAKTQDLDEIIITEFRDPAIASYIKDMIMSRVKITLTLHTSRIWGVVEKFYEYFGKTDFLFAIRNTNLLVQQAMFKQLCPKCKVPLPIEEMTSLERRVYNNLKLEGHTVYTRGNPSQCMVQCNTGYTQVRLPCAETLLLDKTDTNLKEILGKLNHFTDTTELTNALKNFIISSGRSLEYIARERLISGDIDFKKVVEQDIVNNITKEGISKYEALRND